MVDVSISRFLISDVLRCHRMRVLKRLGTPFSDPVTPDFQRLMERREALCESLYLAYSKRGLVKRFFPVEDVHRKGKIDMLCGKRAYIVRLVQPDALRRKNTDMRHLAQIVTCMFLSHEITDGSIIYITENGRARISAYSSLSLDEREKLINLVRRDWQLLIKQWQESVLPPAKPVQQWECGCCLYKKACRDNN